MIDKVLGFFGGGIAGKVALAMAGIIVAMAIGVYFMFGAIGDLHEANGTLKQQNAQLLELSEANAKAVVETERRASIAMAVVTEDRDRALATAGTVNTIVRRIYVAKPDEPKGVCTDVPGAMRTAYDGLLELRAPAGNENRNRDVPRPGTVAVLPAGSDTRPAAGTRR